MQQVFDETGKKGLSFLFQDSYNSSERSIDIVNAIRCLIRHRHRTEMKYKNQIALICIIRKAEINLIAF